jgi:hypothetical protein
MKRHKTRKIAVFYSVNSRLLLESWSAANEARLVGHPCRTVWYNDSIVKYINNNLIRYIVFSISEEIWAEEWFSVSTKLK